MSERVGLATLAERACRELINGGILDEVAGEWPTGEASPFAKAAWKRILSSACQLCSKYGLDTVSVDETPCFEEFDETRIDLGMPLEEVEEFICLQLGASSCWDSFLNTLDEISRFDDFLFTLECDPRCRALARECRDDLALLNVLADWCEDNDRPVAAAEARHLGALVASILRD